MDELGWLSAASGSQKPAGSYQDRDLEHRKKPAGQHLWKAELIQKVLSTSTDCSVVGHAGSKPLVVISELVVETVIVQVEPVSSTCSIV